MHCYGQMLYYNEKKQVCQGANGKWQYLFNVKFFFKEASFERELEDDKLGILH